MEKKRAKASLDKFNRMKKNQIHIRREQEIKSCIIQILNKKFKVIKIVW